MWGRFRQLKRWQQYYVAGLVSSLLMLLFVAGLLLIARGEQMGTVGNLALLLVILLTVVPRIVADRRSRSGFLEEHPEFHERMRWRWFDPYRRMGITEALVRLKVGRWIRRRLNRFWYS